MTTLRFVTLLVVLFFVHVLFYQYLISGSIYPDLLLVIMVYSSLRWGPEGGSIAGFICGLVQDSFSYSFFGLHALTKTIIGYSLGKVRHSLFSNRPIVQLSIIFTSKLLHDLIFYSIYLSGSDSTSIWSRIFYVSLPSGLYTAVLGVAFFYLFQLRTETKGR